MEVKHFNHSHGLVFHQVPQGSHIYCSGCKFPGSGNVYACWQCSYFLHEHCFRATRSLKHPSHPLHPLTLVPSPTYPSASFFCNSCKLGGDGFSYSCSECEFDIHVHCAVIPDPNPHLSPFPVPAPKISAQNYLSQPQNPIYPPPCVPNNPFTGVNPPNQHNPTPVYPQPNATPPPPQPSVSQPTPVPKSETFIKLKHFSHPHALNPTEINQKSGEVCSACEKDLFGSAYCCTEPHCSFNLHKACFDSPSEVQHKSHPHPLTLLTAPASSYGFTCYACQKGGSTGFVYNCATCFLDLHIDCIKLPEKEYRPDHKHPLTLHFSAPVAGGLLCDVCKEYARDDVWVYHCSQCDFGTHLECVHSEIKKQDENTNGEETENIADRLFKLQQQQTHNIIRMQMAQQNAHFMNSLANSWKNFY